MQTWILMIALTAPAGITPALAEESTNAPSLPEHPAAAELAPRMQDGTLLFSTGDCLAVRIYTKSPYTHVAVVMREDGEPHVYDSMNGAGVRRQSLSDYLHSQRSDCMHIFHPRRSLTPEQSRGLREALDSQLGRPYAVKHHLTGARCEGLHCAEYTTDALMAIKLIHAERPSKVSPASLVEGVTAAEIYVSDGTVDLSPAPAPAPSQPVAEGRCRRLWIETKHCVTACCDQLSGWFLCR
ncbi:MAG: hypothetical protein KF861_01740 [Planctomycetaceae bacterium]|nr:hypothetical protein [Planctomycetaceae bacterium]